MKNIYISFFGKKNKLNTFFPVSCLKVYKLNNPKIRMGKDNDGGYVIHDGFKYDTLIGCGISNDISFEEDFIKKYDTKCFAFDGTIEKIPDTNHTIKFIKKNISGKNTKTESNLHEIIERNDNIFLKMDIEGGEYDFIESLNETQLNKIQQIAIEFHRPFMKKRWKCIEKINKTHYLCHIHPNNCCGVSTYNNTEIPNLFECTYVRKKSIDYQPELSTEKIPSKLDMVNVPCYKNIKLKKFPYSIN